MVNNHLCYADLHKDINLIIASIEDIKNMEAWQLADKKISRYATDSFISDYKYYYNNPIDEISGYQYVINKNVWLLKAECDNITIGYVILFYDKTIFTSLIINPIVVNPKMQGKGFGKSIVKK